MVYLKEHRNLHGVTLAKLSEVTGISRRTLEDIQKRGDCLVSNAEKLAKAMNITLDELCKLP